MRSLFLAVAFVGLTACSASATDPVAFDASRPDVATDAGSDTKADTSVVDSGCAAGELRCDGTCVDVTANPMHCGMCGKACASDQTCTAGACACSDGKLLCGGACVDPRVDSNHCGMCDKKCASTENCSESTCQPACPTGESRCGGTCINTASNPNNCGACGTVCSAVESCVASKCVCDFPTKLCGGSCVNINFDAKNCGDCGKVCPSGTGGVAGCTGGSCILTCKTGFANCNEMLSDGCEAELAVDNNNCGTCGVRCPTLTSICQAGACKTCPAGTILCSGSCVNDKNDPKNCGGCGVVCAGSTPNCSNGSCVATCPSGTAGCSGTCTDTATDPDNCGACGTKCSTRTCVASACLSCIAGTITVDIPFGSVTGWTTSGCCTESNYLVATGGGSSASATFADSIPAGSVVKTITLSFGVQHACTATTNAMDFQFNGVSVGTWNSSKGPDCSCGDSRVGDATFPAPTTSYRPGMSNTISIMHNGDSFSDCHEAITTVTGAPVGTAMRAVITYGCP